MAWNSLPNLRTWLKHSAWYAESSSLNQLEIGTFLKWLLGDVNKDECSRVRQAVRLNFRQIIWSLSSDEFVEKHTWSLFDFPQTELHAYFLIQAPETKAIGDSLGFGSSFLFSSAFKPGIRLAATQKLIPSGLLLVFIYLCTVGVHLHLFTG
ncbi:hypothetical protein OIU78_025344 [Salix suchowensis]|nr:hypothetical protein OIU78_025344 [Salix suchowensis]